MSKKDIYQEITNQIISDLEKGTPVWEKPWEKGFKGFPVNVSSKSFYSGINTVILWHRQSQLGADSSQWLTFRQAQNLGGHIKKGEKATCIIFYKKITVEDKKTAQRTVKLLEKRGLIIKDKGAESSFLNIQDTEAMDYIHSSSITYRIAFGKYKGQKALTLKDLPKSHKLKPFLSEYSGFSLHAGVFCPAHNRKKREHLCRYISRV